MGHRLTGHDNIQLTLVSPFTLQPFFARLSWCERRAATWSMQEITTKYDAAVERVAILENEVSTKASLSEEVQRLKDELRGKT